VGMHRSLEWPTGGGGKHNGNKTRNSSFRRDRLAVAIGKGVKREYLLESPGKWCGKGERKREWKVQ